MLDVLEDAQNKKKTSYRSANHLKTLPIPQKWRRQSSCLSCVKKTRRWLMTSRWNLSDQNFVSLTRCRCLQVAQLVAVKYFDKKAGRTIKIIKEIRKTEKNSIRSIFTLYLINRPFRRYGGHFEFYCFK